MFFGCWFWAIILDEYRIRKKESGDGTTWEKKARKTESETGGLCQPGHDIHRNNNIGPRNSMTELAGGELCLLQQPHNQVGAARGRIIQNCNYSPVCPYRCIS